MVPCLDKFEGQGHQGQKTAFFGHFSGLHSVMFGETSLASSFILIFSLTTLYRTGVLWALFYDPTDSIKSKH